MVARMVVMTPATVPMTEKLRTASPRYGAVYDPPGPPKTRRKGTVR